MESSPELENLIRRFYSQEGSGGLLEFARQLYSQHEGVILVGSQPGDIFEGHQAILAMYQQADAMNLEIRVDELKAWQGGDFGWVVDWVTARLPEGLDLQIRHTYLFHREAGSWKIVHTHISVGIEDGKLGLSSSGRE